MRRSLLLVLAGVCALLFAPATVRADWIENFDGYAAGSGLHGQGGWHGWDGSPAADAFVTNAQSLSHPNSVAIAGPSDMVHEYDESAGIWVFTAWQYIPTGFSGQTYFILLNTYNDGGPYNWSCQVSFNSNGNVVLSDGDGGTLPMIIGQWVELRVEINLDQDLQIFYYNGQMLYQKSWTNGVSGGGLLQFGAVDLFANGASSVYYDNLSLLPFEPTPVEKVTWGRLKDTFR